MRKALTAMILLWCAAQTVGFGQGRVPAESAPGEIVAGKLGAQLDQYLTRLAAYGFSGTVLVAKEGEVVLHQGYGWADRERHWPNTISTVYDVASLSSDRLHRLPYRHRQTGADQFRPQRSGRGEWSDGPHDGGQDAGGETA